MAKKPKKTKATAKAKSGKSLDEPTLEYQTAYELITLILEKLGNEDFVFRGVPKNYQTSETEETYINSSIFRKYHDEITFSGDSGEYQPVHIESEIVVEASTYFKPETTTIEKLSDIRHFGGDTTLIDFSKDVLVALFFACQTDRTKDGQKEDGQLFALRTSEIETITNIDYEKDFGIKRDSYDRGSYDKVDLNQSVSSTLRLIAPIMTATNKARVVAQKSIFIHAPRGYIEPSKCIIIPIKSELKPDILAYLDRFYDINQHTIYNDLHGLIDAQEHGSQARLSFFKGNKHLFEGNFENAMDCFNNAIQFKPDFAEAYFSRGVAKKSLGQHEDAITDFGQAIQLNPDDAIAYHIRGLAYQALGKTKEAEADFAKAKELGFTPTETDDNTPT